MGTASTSMSPPRAPSPGSSESWSTEGARDIGLGPYPTVSLAQARSLGADNRAAVAEGRDPMAEKQATKEAARNPAPSVPAFQDAFAEVFKLRRGGWSSKKHAGQWKSTIETYAFPVIGHKTVDKITRSDALAVLKPIWTEKNETATRVRAAHGDGDGLGYRRRLQASRG